MKPTNIPGETRQLRFINEGMHIGKIDSNTHALFIARPIGTKNKIIEKCLELNGDEKFTRFRQLVNQAIKSRERKR